MVVVAVQVAEGLRQVGAELLAVGHLAGDSMPVTCLAQGPWTRAPALAPPCQPSGGTSLAPAPWPCLPLVSPRSPVPHQAVPEEVAGTETHLPGQRTEEGVLKPPAQLGGAG